MKGQQVPGGHSVEGRTSGRGEPGAGSARWRGRRCSQSFLAQHRCPRQPVSAGTGSFVAGKGVFTSVCMMKQQAP